MEEIITRSAYKLVSALIEEFLEDCGSHPLDEVDARGLRLIATKMERHGSLAIPLARPSSTRLTPVG